MRTNRFTRYWYFCQSVYDDPLYLILTSSLEGTPIKRAATLSWRRAAAPPLRSVKQGVVYRLVLRREYRNPRRFIRRKYPPTHCDRDRRVKTNKTSASPPLYSTARIGARTPPRRKLTWSRIVPRWTSGEVVKSFLVG